MNRLLSLAACALSLAATAQVNPPRIALQTWATGVSRPVYMTHAGDDRLFLVQRQGVIKIITDSMEVAPTPFLDIAFEVNSSGFAGDEQGLLGLAFDPDYATNGFFYVNYIFGTGSGESRISRFQVSSNPDSAIVASEAVLYTVDQPYTNHNGGCLQFGPDGYLYCGFGDGGSANDPDANGQDFTTPLGKMIRIDVSAHDSTYAIPPDNPFVGATDTLPEIWAGGLRNPWRFSFDRQNGDLWIGDVGQGTWEEVDFWPAGDNSGPNFGWRCREAFVATPGVSQAGCGDAEDYIDPVAAFSHGVQGWCSAIGGYVYRGSAYPHLAGKYIFTDYCAGDFLTFGDNYALDTLLATFNAGYSSFGEDVNGELYVADVDHNSVKKIVDACPMPDPTVSVNDAEITASDADGWQWYLNGTAIPGADQQSWTATTNGEYAVLADLGGTCQLFSAPVSVIVTGIQGVAGQAPSVFPQPTADLLQLRATAPLDTGLQVQLRDAAGRMVRSLYWPAGTTLLSFDVADLAPGSYVLHGSGPHGNWHRLVEVAR
jgi:glucose/arabinose dehydrogenase